MFHVGRYDPSQDERDKKRAKSTRLGNHQSSGRERQPLGKRRKSEGPARDVAQDEFHAPPKSTLHVIAPESIPESKQKSKVSNIPDEAFDDLEIVDDLLESSNPEHSKEEQQLNYNVTAETPAEIRTAIHMSSLPIEEAASIWNLAPFLVQNLLRDGYKNFFPIQSLVIPDVITSERHSHIRVRDVCVAAPTGSGKTLAFVIPILNSLANRQVKRLRALVVLPSRDLALQVFEVFEKYTAGSDLKVGIAIGQSDFASEQRSLTVGQDNDTFSCMDPTLAMLRAHLDPTNVERTLNAFSLSDKGQETFKLPRGGVSAVDVLVCTPGRVVDHLENTPGFTLQHLRFLVIDEADRLLSQSYHNWIGRVISSSNSASIAAWHEMKLEHNGMPPGNQTGDWPLDIDPITWRRGGTGGDDSNFNKNDGSSSVVASVCQPVQLRKLLYSATLTRDPQKLAVLGLVNPKHYDAHSLSSSGSTGNAVRYSIPSSLSEYTIECTAEQKPLILLGLLIDKTQNKGLVVVFTSSLDSTHRLARLLQLVWKTAQIGSPESVAEYSSLLKQHQRTELVRKCNNPSRPISVVVCSDSMSRGMDVECVRTVINYDVPSFAKTYVHRCGRTARAGREGSAISLVKGGQTKNFARIRALIDNAERVKTMAVDKESIRPIVRAYKSCIQSLRSVLTAESDGDLNALEPIPLDLFPTI